LFDIGGVMREKPEKVAGVIPCVDCESFFLYVDSTGIFAGAAALPRAGAAEWALTELAWSVLQAG